jgi:hypothetical protein
VLLPFDGCLVTAGRAGGTLVFRTVAAAEPSFHDVVSNRGPDLAAGEPELAEIAIPLEHQGPDGTPRGGAIEGAAHIVLVLQLPAIPVDRLVQRRSHRNGGALRMWTSARKDTHLKRLAGPVVK